jgi:hypothetical protein
MMQAQHRHPFHRLQLHTTAPLPTAMAPGYNPNVCDVSAPQMCVCTQAPPVAPTTTTVVLMKSMPLLPEPKHHQHLCTCDAMLLHWGLCMGACEWADARECMPTPIP